MPSLSARLQSVENCASHLPKSGVPPPIFATLAFAPNRQEQYLPVVFSSLDSHSPAGASAHALAASNRTPAKVAVAVVIALVFMALSGLRVQIAKDVLRDARVRRERISSTTGLTGTALPYPTK